MTPTTAAAGQGDAAKLAESQAGPGYGWQTAIPVGFWLVGMLVVYSPVIPSGLRWIDSDLGDPRLVNYTLEHGYRQLLSDPLHL